MISFGTVQRKYIIFAICLIVAIFEYRILWLIHKSHIIAVLEGSLGPVNGLTSVFAFKNRVLAGTIIQSISKETGIPIVLSFDIFCIMSLALANIVVFFSFLKQSKSERIAFQYLGFFIILFLLLQDNFNIYAWDYSDLVIFSALVFGIVYRLPSSFFGLLFIIGIFNRESALFIPVWMMIDSFKSKKEILWGQMGFSFLLIGVGAGIIFFLRDYAHRLPSYRLFPDETILGNHFYLFSNINDLIANVMRFQLESVINIFLIAVLMLGVWKWRTMTLVSRKITILLAVIIIANFLFGIINETRIWLISIPLLLTVALSIDTNT